MHVGVRHRWREAWLAPAVPFVVFRFTALGLLVEGYLIAGLALLIPAVGPHAVLVNTAVGIKPGPGWTWGSARRGEPLIVHIDEGGQMETTT